MVAKPLVATRAACPDTTKFRSGTSRTTAMQARKASDTSDDGRKRGWPGLAARRRKAMWVDARASGTHAKVGARVIEQSPSNRPERIAIRSRGASIRLIRARALAGNSQK